jgi:hypothetical protein
MVSEDPVARTVSCWFSGMALVVPSADRVVTVACNATSTDRMRPGFPANSQLHSPTLPLGGAAPLACEEAFATLGISVTSTQESSIEWRGGQSLPPSSCRHEDRTVSSSVTATDARRTVSEGSAECGFLLIVRTGHIVTTYAR